MVMISEYLGHFAKEPEEWLEYVPKNSLDSLVEEARKFLVYDGHIDYLKEMRYPLIGDHYVRYMRRGRRYEKRLKEIVESVYSGNLRGLDIIMFYKVLNDARHVLDGTIKGTGLESKLNLRGWRGRKYSLDELRGKWRELMNDRRLNPRIKEFFQLLDRYDSKITEAVEYALFLKGLFPKPLDPGSLEEWDVYREGVRRAVRYLEEVILFSEEIERDLLPENANSFYQNLFVFNNCGDYYCPLELIRQTTEFLFDGIKERIRHNLPFLEAYIVSKYNPARKDGHYVFSVEIPLVDGDKVVDTVKLPIYSKRQNLSRQKAREILSQAGYEL